MANQMEATFDNTGGANQQEQIIESAQAGRVQLSVFGNLDGCKIQIRKQLVLSDGTTSSITTIREFSDEIDLALELGRKNNLYVQCTGMGSSTQLFCQARYITY